MESDGSGSVGGGASTRGGPSFQKAGRPGGDAWRDVPGREQEVNIVTTRFGLVQVSMRRSLIRIPGRTGRVPFVQTLYRPVARFRVVDRPVLAAKRDGAGPGLRDRCRRPWPWGDYRIELRPGDRAALELDDERSALDLRDPEPRRRRRPRRSTSRAPWFSTRSKSARPPTGADLQPICGPKFPLDGSGQATAPTLLPGPNHSPFRATA